MSTNVETWINVDTIGAVYPFPGSEVMLTIAALVFWIVWHIWQISSESREFSEDLRKIEAKGGIAKVLDEQSSREAKDAVGG